MDKYLQFNHLELSEDPSFIRWAKGSESTDDLDWDGWLANHPEMNETVQKAKSLVMSMVFVTEEAPIQTADAVWNRISTSINTSEKVSDPIQRRGLLVRMIPYVAAAAVALLLFIFQFGDGYNTTIRVPLAKVDNIELPDGSKVTVNAQSTVKYNTESWNEDRRVLLQGEAFFDVKKGSKFIVETGAGSIEVLGTSFNVYERKDMLSVQCETGRVMVRADGKQTILTPQQAVTVVDGFHDFKERVNETNKRSTWRSGLFVYESRPLGEVAAELERQFDVRIQLDNEMKARLYNGSFMRSDLNDALTEVFYPLNLQFSINGKTVVISD